jgi:hypothetical protein
MWSIIREGLIYLGFLVVVCIITYSNRDQNDEENRPFQSGWMNQTTQISNSSIDISSIRMD